MTNPLLCPIWNKVETKTLNLIYTKEESLTKDSSPHDSLMSELTLVQSTSSSPIQKQQDPLPESNEVGSCFS